MNKFRQEYGKYLTESKIKSIFKNYVNDLCDFNFHIIERGRENINIIISIKSEKWILRVYNDKQFERDVRDEEHLMYELKFLDYLHSNQLPVAGINRTLHGELYSRVRLNHISLFVVVFDYVSGSIVNNPNTVQISEVAKVMAKMHNLSEKYKVDSIRESGSYHNYLDWWECATRDYRIVKDRDINEAYLPIIKYFQSQIKEVPNKNFKIFQIHADMHQGNMHFKGSELMGVFDFDDTRHSIAPEDIGMFFHVLFKKGNRESCERKVKTFFYEYEKLRKLTSGEKLYSFYYALEKRYQGRYFEAREDEIDGKLTKEKKAYYLNYTKRFRIIKSIIDYYS